MGTTIFLGLMKEPTATEKNTISNKKTNKNVKTWHANQMGTTSGNTLWYFSQRRECGCTKSWCGCVYSIVFSRQVSWCCCLGTCFGRTCCCHLGTGVCLEQEASHGMFGRFHQRTCTSFDPCRINSEILERFHMQLPYKEIQSAKLWQLACGLFLVKRVLLLFMEWIQEPVLH